MLHIRYILGLLILCFVQWQNHLWGQGHVHRKCSEERIAVGPIFFSYHFSSLLFSLFCTSFFPPLFPCLPSFFSFSYSFPIPLFFPFLLLFFLSFLPLFYSPDFFLLFSSSLFLIVFVFVLFFSPLYLSRPAALPRICQPSCASSSMIKIKAQEKDRAAEHLIRINYVFYHISLCILHHDHRST